MNINLGKIIEGEGEAERDAIHVAVAPIFAGEELAPGQHVGISFGSAYSYGKKIGIVDPFLVETVHAGQRFWLFLYPKTVQNLRHDWRHPAFERRQINPDIEDFDEHQCQGC